VNAKKQQKNKTNWSWSEQAKWS